MLAEVSTSLVSDFGKQNFVYWNNVNLKGGSACLAFYVRVGATIIPSAHAAVVLVALPSKSRRPPDKVPKNFGDLEIGAGAH